MTVPPPNRDYAITSMYSLPDDAWQLELKYVPEQRCLVIAVVPDEDPGLEPTVCFDGQGLPREVPYEVVRWFMGRVEDEIRSSRAWMRLRPELVATVHRLRREHTGWIDDEDFPGALAELRSAVAEDDLAAVLAAAFARSPDGTEIDGAEVFRLLEAASR